MRTLLAALGAVLCCPAAAAAAPFAELPFQPLRDNRPATCLQAAGADRIGLVNRVDDESEAVALVRVAPDGALAVEAAAPLGLLLECPSVAAAASGAAVVAHASLEGPGMELVVAIREPGGALERPLRVPGARGVTIRGLDTAIASGGAAVAAWTETRRRQRASRLRVIRRAAGGTFGQPETLGNVTLFGEPVVGVDDAGRATVAWEPDGVNEGVVVATAAQGGGFGPPQRLTRADGVGNPLALAVSADGGALLAYEANDGIRVFERVPGAARMTPGPRYPARPDVTREQPVVALAPDGGAAVAWLLEGARARSVEVGLRPPAGAFQPSQVLDQRVPGAAGWAAAAAAPAFEAVDDEGALQAGVGAGGTVVVGWLERTTIAGGDTPARVALAAGTLTGGWEGTELGGPGRSADGLAVLAAPAAVLWTDNLPRTDFGFELPLGSGRLHRALPGVAPQDPAPPEVTLQARRQRVRSREPVVVHARCTAACDLRAVAGASSSGGPAGVGAAQLDETGTARIVVQPTSLDGLVPRRGRPLRVTVHATAPAGIRPAVARLDARVRHAFVPRPRTPLDVRITPRGKRLVVTWRTAKPARAEVFRVTAARRRADLGGLSAVSVTGRGRTRFRSVVDDGGTARWVAIEWTSTEPRLEGDSRFFRVPGRE